MADQVAFVERVLHLLAPLGDVRVRRMFGGRGLFLEGRMFALISRNGGLFLKADEINKGEFEARGCLAHNDIFYFSTPDEALQSWEEMAPWAQGAVGAAERAAAKKSKRKSKRDSSK